MGRISTSLWIRWFAVLLCASLGQSVRGQGLLPARITEQRLDRLLQYVTLSDEQNAHIRRLHKIYLLDLERVEMERTKYLKLRGSVYVSPDRFEGESMEQTYREALNLQQQLHLQLRAITESFFDEIEAVLSIDQTQRMQRVRLAHDRWTYSRSTSITRERHVDVVNLVDEMTLSDEDHDRVEEVLRDYEPLFVQALREAAETDQRIAVYEFAILDIDRESNGSPDENDLAAVSVLMEKRERPRVRASLRLVDVNRRGLEMLKATLSPDAAVALQLRYNEAAYPEVYPDPVFAGPVYVAALELTDLSDDQRNALIAFRGMYATEHATLSEQLKTSIFTQSVRPIRYAEAEYAKRALMVDEIRTLAIKRESLNLAQPPKIRAILLPEQNEQLKPWRYENQQPPRPWARVAGLPRDSQTSSAERRARQREQQEPAAVAEPTPQP